MRTLPEQALLLDAGLGGRMAPLDDRQAKALVKLDGRPLIDHTLDRLSAAGVRQVVVCVQHHAEQVADHLAGREAGPDVVLRPMQDARDGRKAAGAALAEGLLGPAPFYVVNGDCFWLDGPAQALQRLGASFDPARHDAVLLVHRAFQVVAEVGFGEFLLDKWGHPRRRAEREVAPYVFAGVQLASPALFATDAAGAGFDRLWDAAMAAERLEAVVHDGLWYRLSDPADLADAEASLHARALGETR